MDDRQLHIVGAGTIVDLQLSGSYLFDGQNVVKHQALAIVMPAAVTATTRIMHGCSPASSFFEITRIEGPEVFELDGRPAIEFLGDGIMSVFPQQTENAIDAGIATLHEVQDYNNHRRQQSRPAIKIGIGLNTGPMMVGMVGYDKRIQGDAFSDAVNLTSRVESLTKNYGVSFLITAETLTSLNNPDDYDIRFVDRVRVKGKKQSLDLYEVFNADEDRQRDLKRETAKRYQAAIDAYYSGYYKTAQSGLFAVLQQNPADKPAWNRLLLATRALDEGPPDDWDTTVMTHK